MNKCAATSEIAHIFKRDKEEREGASELQFLKKGTLLTGLSWAPE